MSIKVSGGGGGLPPGITGDGQTPGGLLVAGKVRAGDVNGVLSVDSTIHGTLTVYDTTEDEGFGSPVAAIRQQATLAADNPNATFEAYRDSELDGHVYDSPVGVIASSVASAADIILSVESNAASGAYGYADKQAMVVNGVGGMGLFGHSAPTAPRTLPQATITAITDANAKAAVQAIANALSDMGALTLT